MPKPGPPPKREAQRRRRNEPDQPTRRGAAGKVKRRPARRGWHPIARQWYNALADSGQSAFYEQSDWDTAYVVAESMSREFKPQPVVAGDKVTMMELPPKAASVQAWLRAAVSLCATEGDRRRAGIELDRGDESEGAADVSWFDDAKRRLRESG